MTREEAINEIKSWDFLEGKEIEAIHTLIPELRESEDERIRKEIIDFIQWAEDRGMTRHDYHQAKRPAVWIAYLEKQKECVVDNNKTSAEEDERIRARLIEYFKGFLEGYEDCYKDGGCVKWEGLDVKSILAWLEKQKETANSFTDGVIEVRSFQRGLEEGKRLERQKENSKSADSISSDCESNAKCENRWHKVEDSLPDSTREVLCKDAIGNYFIGRYYSKGVWEVSMYDDCDKSNEDNPPVVKWCEIPSEKQKEQKPAEWSEEDENKIESIKGLITMGKFVDTNTIKTIWKLLDSLRPQPKVEWSEEDEKIVNNIVSVLGQYIDYKQVSGIGTGYATPRYAKEIDWLKSLRPVSKEFLQPHWKPSEEQMEALKKVACNLVGTGTETDVYLIQLFEQLKKL